MRQGTTEYLFEDLPILRLPGGGAAGFVSGQALLHYDAVTRDWKIKVLSLRNEADGADPALIDLLPDRGPDACGPYELVHDALICERKDRLAAHIDRICDRDNREGLGR